MNARIWISTALCSTLFSIAHGQSLRDPGNPWERGKAGLVIELAAKSSDNDDAGGSSSHSSTKKKKSSGDDDEKPSTPKPATAKKKKKVAEDGDDAAAGKGETGKKSGISDGDSPSPKKKKSDPDADDATPRPKTKAVDEKSPKDASQEVATDSAKHAPAATVEPDAIAEFSKQPERVQHLITAALDLTKLNLTYTYGSAEPSNGGMDCSGTIYYLLHSQGFQDIPRDSSGQYVWARKEGRFFAVVSTKADSFEFKDLLPGDLMFWTGTYQVERDIPISHVMLYLGKEKGSGNRIMFGSSDGRSYNGVQRWGVSVFDFKMPKNDPNNTEKRRVDFVGYARIPGLREAIESAPPSDVAAVEEPKASSTKKTIAKDSGDKDADESTPAPKKKSSAKKSTPRKRTDSSDN